MKINDVTIMNWTSPGNEYWDTAETNPDKPLIVAKITMTLSYNEYMKVLDQDEHKQKSPPTEADGDSRMDR